MPLLQPGGGGTFDVWAIGNYRWAEAFIWIAALSALIFGIFVFARYLNTRKKQLLLWAFAFFGIWIFNYQMILTYITESHSYGPLAGMTTVEAGPGLYTWLVGGFDATGWLGLPIAMLLVLVPGFIAAGLCYKKDEKFGKIYTLYVVVLSIVYAFFLAAPNIGLIPKDTLIAAILCLLVQLPSGALIIALPIMEDVPLGPKVMLITSGALMLTNYIFMWLVRLMEALGAPMNPIEGGSIDIFLMIYPFFFIISVLCLIFGLVGHKDYGFEVPHVEFED